MNKYTIKKMGINGEGIAYVDHSPIFIQGALVNEVVTLDEITTFDTYAKATIGQILTPSKERITPPCKVQDRCGGCALMHLDPKAQLIQKRNILVEALYKYANVSEQLVRETKSDGEAFHYRNACKMPLRNSGDGRIQAGLYAPNSNRFTTIYDCHVQNTRLERIRKDILNVLQHHNAQAFDPKRLKGLRFLVMRSIDDQTHATLVTGKSTLSKELINDLLKIDGLTGLFVSVNTNRHGVEIFGKTLQHLGGDAYLTFMLDHLKLRLSPRSFFQLNTNMAKMLYQMAVSKIDPCDTLVEAYCGIGAMSLLASNKAKHVYGIENVAEAIENAKANALANHIDNVDFIQADAAVGLQKILLKQKVDTLLVDPPRAGLDEAMVQTILTSTIDKIIYISCNPSTLARNLKDLKQNYQILTIIPFDMFPNTPHVESITVLMRHGISSGKQSKIKKRKAKERAKKHAIQAQ